MTQTKKILGFFHKNMTKPQKTSSKGSIVTQGTECVYMIQFSSLCKYLVKDWRKASICQSNSYVLSSIYKESVP